MRNLSGVPTSMTYVLEQNAAKFNNCTSVLELVNMVNNLFYENNIFTPASRRLIQNLSKSHNVGSAMITLYNSMLCGGNLAVIK